MCGIFGIIGEYDASKARTALSKLSHRGRDHCGIIEKNQLFFAHQRLSIQDLQENAHQPFKYKNILLSFNGEIYNYKDLKQELSQSFEFKSSSDGEVLIAAYLKWGIDFVLHLRGMFAIALLDKDTLYLFRDRLGKKPLFFMHAKSFIFASEIKAITPFLQKTQMNEDALMSYLSFLAPTPPHTFFQGIKKLAAGEYLTFKDNVVTVQRYFDLLDVTPNIITSQEEVVASLEKLLDESISMRLHADVPIASLLSGGIDSAAINAYALKHSHNLQTYTIGYEGFSKYDETGNAENTASYLGLKNKKIIISQDDFVDASDTVLDTLDEPLNDPAAVPLYLLFQSIAKDGYKVVMSGEGSDELFLGYRQYFEYLDIENARNLKHKNWLKNYFKANYSQHREWEHYKRIFNDTLLFRTSGENFTDLQKNNLMKRNVKEGHSLQYIQSYRDRFELSVHTHESTWYSYIDLHLYQAEHFLTKLDRVSMAHNIESRTPFLDHELASYIFSLSPQLRHESGVTKSLLKKTLEPYLNNVILSRRKKGFANPYYEYLLSSNKLKLIEEVNKETGIFKEKELNEYLKTSSNNNFKKHIWGLYVLSIWIKKNLL
ncbi:MAG: asparagine synthase (glutamine-hydrolyzing) [Sulfurimonas sp.]|jgi:asparagine synthase (glutamine-hydrolysing)|uniref:asparagine synthase (glutamine-hydrolyzing) n=1 Tax=Sulfurimonas sp. TaxID=2022749 RepID=UPI0039E59B0C